eukprot:1353510-Rhodomonas_salina.2
MNKFGDSVIIPHGCNVGIACRRSGLTDRAVPSGPMKPQMEDASSTYGLSDSMICEGVKNQERGGAASGRWSKFGAGVELETRTRRVERERERGANLLEIPPRFDDLGDGDNSEGDEDVEDNNDVEKSDDLP